MLQPARAQAAFRAFTSSATAPTRLSERSPATGSGTIATTCPSSTTQTPPRPAATASRATRISASFSPATMTLCESWPTLLATAPRFRPKAESSPWAIPPVRP